MGWEFILAIVSFVVLLAGWVVLPIKEQRHKEAQKQTISVTSRRKPAVS